MKRLNGRDEDGFTPAMQGAKRASLALHPIDERTVEMPSALDLGLTLNATAHALGISRTTLRRMRRREREAAA